MHRLKLAKNGFESLPGAISNSLARAIDGMLYTKF